MKMLAGLAWKNLSRYRRRTLITATALAVGLALFIYVDSLLAGIDQESQRNLIWYETGSASIMTTEYFEDRELLPLDAALEAPGELLAELGRRGINAAPRTTFQGELIVYQDPYPADGSMVTQVHAIDPARDPQVFRLPDTVAAGRYLQPGENGVLLGSWLAEDLGAEVGYPMTVVTKTRDGFYQTMDLEVVGILEVPNPVINRTGVFVPLDTADEYLQMRGAVTEIAISLPLQQNAQAVADQLEEELSAAGGRADGGAEGSARGGAEPEAFAPGAAGGPADGGADSGGLVVKSWQELVPGFVALTEQKSVGTGVILFLVFVIAAVGISNTMLMSVYERVREIGMLRAIGMGDRRIRQLFLLEAGGIGLLGALLGVALGAALTALMVYVGIDYSWLVRDMDIGYRVLGVMRGAWNPGTMVTAALISVVLTVAVAWVPTRRAIGMNIPDALRHQ
jgi:ABC-type lipoprotein release transport system permease subunit